MSWTVFDVMRMREYKLCPSVEVLLPFAFKLEACKFFHVCLRFKRNVPGGNHALLTNETDRLNHATVIIRYIICHVLFEFQ